MNHGSNIYFQRKIVTPDKPETSKPPSRGSLESMPSPYDRFNPRTGYPDTPALRQLRLITSSLNVDLYCSDH